MKKSGLRDFLERLFPSAAEQKSRTSELVERALESLRRARNERSFAMGSVTRVPSHLELRLPQERYDELVQIGAVRDLSYFLTDELMKDLDAEGLRTFGDHAVRVSVTVDPSLLPNEIYGMVLSPEPSAAQRASAASAPPPATGGDDFTRALGNQDDATQAIGQDTAPTQLLAGAAAPPTVYKLQGTGPDDFSIDRTLDGTQWIIGRRGDAGPLPQGFRKFDLDVRQTVSRHQVQAVLLQDSVMIKRIGKAAVILNDDLPLDEGAEGALEYGAPFVIEDYKFVISR